MNGSRRSRWPALLGLAVALLAPSRSPGEDLTALAENLANARVGISEARLVTQLTFEVGPAKIRLERGFLFPVTLADGDAP